MKLIVAGGRDYETQFAEWEELFRICDANGVEEVVTGGCRGVDQEAEEWAERLGLKTTTFRPAWDKYGRAAGPLRNAEMAAYADALAVFPGGAGTTDMANKMRAAGKPVYQVVLP